MTHRLLVMTMTLPLIAGCRTYQPRPLDLSGYLHEWDSQSLAVPPVLAYVEALGDASEGSARAAPFDVSNGISLSEAEAVALHFNPELRSARSEANVPLAGAKEAGWWPDPQLEAQIMRFANRGRKSKFRLKGPSLDGINAGVLGGSGLSAAGVEATPAGYRRSAGDFIDDPWIVGASLSLTIPISGRLAVEQDLKWSEYSASWRQILVREWQLLTLLRDAWFEWSIAGERVSVTRTYLDLLSTIAGMTEQLSAAGEMKPTDARVLKIELARQRTQLLTLESDQQQKKLALLALMGIAPDAPIVLKPTLFASAIAVPESERRSQLLQHHPRIKAAEADYEASEQQLRLEVREQYPDLQLGPSYSLDEGFSRVGLGFGFPIPLWNRNRQGIAEALAARDATRARVEAVVQVVMSELSRVETQLKFASRQQAFLQSDVAPIVDRQVEDSRTLLDLGEVDVLLLRDALTSSLDTKLDILDSMLTEARAANTLEQMLQPRWFTPSETETAETKEGPAQASEETDED